MASVLAVEPVSLRFNASQSEGLLAELERFDRSSDVMTIGYLEDVEMAADGSFGSSSLRPTTWCLYQICRAICPGLYQALVELTADGSEDSRLAAVSMFNQVVRLRFVANLHSQRFLCDRASGTVEAMVGSTYCFMPNRQFYEQVNESLLSASSETRFYEAAIYGRWFMVRYCGVAPLVRTEWDEFSYHEGWHFSNHEGGKASMRATNALVRSRNLLALLLPFGNGRYVRHKGAKMVNRLKSMLGRVISYAWQPETVEANLRRLAMRPLGLGSATEEDEKAKHAKLATKLARMGDMPVSIAARVVANAILHPYNASKPQPSCSLSNNDLAGRTAMDLTMAAAREAKGRDIATRELLEQLAYRLYLGRTKLLE